jgi:glutathione S-transferase
MIYLWASHKMSRIALECAGIEYTDSGQSGGVDYAEMKQQAGTSKYPFGQVPVLIDHGANKRHYATYWSSIQHVWQK